MSCGIGSPKQLFRVVTNAEGTLAPYRAPDPRGGRAPFRNTFIPASHQTGGDVVVTARRRAETIQTVPIAISVIGGTALAETGTYNVNRLTQIQPTLQFYSTNPRNSAANIRGLG